MKKIIVTESISDKGVALLKAQKDFQVDVKMNLTREELLEQIPEYDAVVVRSVTKINEEFYQHAANLKVVAGPVTGWIILKWKGRPSGALLWSTLRNPILCPPANTPSVYFWLPAATLCGPIK